MNRQTAILVALAVVLALAGLLAVALLVRPPEPQPARPTEPFLAPPTVPSPATRPAGTLPPVTRPSTGTDALLVGTPTPVPPDDFLLTKETFATSYNDARGTPNWSQWRLVKADLGGEERGEFFPDLTLPKGFKRVTSKDYTNSGFDRGHLCPAADRAHSKAATDGTFVMTNIVPQAPDVNRKAWAYLEEWCRDQARAGKTLYVAAGPHGEGGVGSAGERVTLAGGKVVVPAECWKVVGVFDRPDVSSLRRVVAVVMPNKQGAGSDWSAFRVPASRVEAMTSRTFFGGVPEAVAGPLKREADRGPVKAK